MNTITKGDGSPFPNRASAASRQAILKKDGRETELKEVEGGFVLEEKPQRTPKRVPLGNRNVLSFGRKDPNYTYRVVNDLDGRLDMFLEAGWEVVKGSGKLGDNYAGNTTGPGSSITKPVGHGITGVLLRKKKDWYKEDYAEKQKVNDASEQALVQKAQMDNLKAPRGEAGIKIQ
jgi:hypothetical protein